MNILIPLSWIKEYIKTNAKPEEIAEALSLHAFSVEKVEKQGGDHIFEIEITPNRGDALSVLGVAREVYAALKRKGHKVQFIDKKVGPRTTEGKDKLKVIIKDKDLVPRFSAVVLENVSVKESPKIIQERLEKVGIRPLGNVIDITNYMMIDRGQPMHAFDYDKIKGSKMIVRKSKDGEEITTLDGIIRKLPEGVIVIEDGEGRLIDLCGIMGAQNSEVTEDTKKVLLFVQVYDPVRIRKASMTLGHRTDAALRFEKGIDSEGVVSSLWEAVDFLEEYADATVSSELIDIVNVNLPEKEIPIDYERINEVAGIDLDKSVVDSTLTDLGFEIKTGLVKVPSWRYDDIEITEDLAEEVIRIFGYYDLPNRLPDGEIPQRKEDTVFYWERFAKEYLKYQGFFECYTTSTTTEELAGVDAIGLINPLSEDLSHLKTSLLPQLLEVLDKNKGYSEKIKVFELASVYLPNNSDLPKQPLRLGIATRGIDVPEIKGIVESLFEQTGIRDYGEFEIREFGGDKLGVEIDFEKFSDKATKSKTYIPLTSFNSIKEDLTFEVPEGVTYQEIEEKIEGTDERILKVSFKDIYNNALTFSIEFLSKDRQISSEDTQEIREKIFERLTPLGVKLKV
ncbi:phenylalanine--tRNA ligase subunit beta [Patescibacteria group bacterium]